MKLRTYVVLWLVITLVLTYENLMLNSLPKEGFLGLFQGIFPQLSDLNLSPEPGRPVSLYLGWAGIGTMLLTNFYIFRKRFGFLKKLGKMAGWLDFHIFCGLLGPTLIIFHTNFKVRGLVAISFWSMMVVAVSGVVGRYFYGQVIRVKSDLEKEAQAHELSLKGYAESVKLPAAQLEGALQGALKLAGGAALLQPAEAGILSIFFNSLAGDLRMLISPPPAPPGTPAASRSLLKKFAIARRRALFFETFQQYLGYWHSFHLPFAFFMYLVAVIHIITAMLFGV